MKVAINTCHGGFSLSKAAAEALAERKGQAVGIDYYHPDIKRYDPDLVAVIESLGPEASSGLCAELAVVEVPAASVFRVAEYDGFEWIEYRDDIPWTTAT